MSITLVTTVGSASANSYNSEAELDAIAATLFPAPVAWATAEPDDRARAAVTMADVLDRLPFRGEPVDSVQARAWPRYPALKPDGLTHYLTTEIPVAVRHAHARLVFFVLDQHAAGVDPFAAPDGAGLQAISFGGEMSLTFEKGAAAVTPGEQFLASVIRPILTGLVTAVQPRTVRG